MPLTEQKKLFADNYLISFNATEAAKEAKYSKKTAYSQGQRLLKNVEVQKYLQSKKDKIAKKLDISQERTMLEIGRIAFQDVRKFYNEDGSLIPIHELDDDAAAVLAGMDFDEIFEYEDGVKKQIGVTKKIRRYDKTKALEMLAKHYKIYSDAPALTNNMKFGYGPEQPV